MIAIRFINLLTIFRCSQMTPNKTLGIRNLNWNCWLLILVVILWEQTQI